MTINDKFSIYQWAHGNSQQQYTLLSIVDRSYYVYDYYDKGRCLSYIGNNINRHMYVDKESMFIK